MNKNKETTDSNKTLSMQMRDWRGVRKICSSGLRKGRRDGYYRRHLREELQWTHVEEFYSKDCDKKNISRENGSGGGNGMSIIRDGFVIDVWQQSVN